MVYVLPYIIMVYIVVKRGNESKFDDNFSGEINTHSGDL